MIYVLYHSSCYDGFGAAFAAWKKFGSDAIYIPVSYGYPPPDLKGADTVYILDFSYPLDTILQMKESVQKIVILDHHKTAEEDLRALTYGTVDGIEVVFDMNRSGALIAWEYFHKEPAPLLIKHISDRDLWNFKMEGTKEVHAYLCSKPFDFGLWASIDIDQAVIVGKILLDAKTAQVEKICKNAWLGMLDEYRVPLVNTVDHWSEVGHRLLEIFPEAPFAASFTVFKDHIMFSLRSRGDFDVSAYAKDYGGGGHKAAAGFKVPYPNFLGE